MRNWNLYFNIPNSRINTQKYQYSIKGGCCNVKYIQGQSPKKYGYEIFGFSGVGEHAYNFGPLHIEVA